jgi:hypothetical protein
MEQKEFDKLPENPTVVKLHIEVRDKNAKLLTERFIDDDMFLDQWAMTIAALFKNLGNGTYSGSGTFSCKNSAGTAITLGGAASTGNSPFFASALEGLTGQLKVAIGTGTTGAAHTDYYLQTPISGASAYPSSITESNPSGSILYVSFSVTITLSSAYTVSEAVVVIIVKDSSGNNQAISITHDVFTGVAVPANGSITLNYTFQFNTS